MLDYLMSGGPFMFPVALFGLAALALNVVQIASRGRRDYTVLVIALTAAAFLTGIAGSGMGMYMAGTTLHGAAAATIPQPPQSPSCSSPAPWASDANITSEAGAPTSMCAKRGGQMGHDRKLLSCRAPPRTPLQFAINEMEDAKGDRQ